jgi:hypothetical protein
VYDIAYNVRRRALFAFYGTAVRDVANFAPFENIFVGTGQDNFRLIALNIHGLATRKQMLDIEADSEGTIAGKTRDPECVARSCGLNLAGAQ